MSSSSRRLAVSSNARAGGLRNAQFPRILVLSLQVVWLLLLSSSVMPQATALRGLKKSNVDNNKDKKKGDKEKMGMGMDMGMMNKDDKGDDDETEEEIGRALCPEKDNPCVHGDCEPISIAPQNGSGFDFRCFCHPGYVGQFCEVEDPCLNDPCLNGGICDSIADNDGTYTCDCGPAFVGNDCELPNPCYNANPCMNGGECFVSFHALVYGVPRTTCQCLEGYSGKFCGTSAFEVEEEKVFKSSGALNAGH